MLRELVAALVRDGARGAAACFSAQGKEAVAAAGEAEPDDTFGIASVTKTFVAAATLRLTAAGVLALDEPAQRWCELVPSDVTVRMLLDHTSRIPDYMRVPGVVEAYLQEPDRVWEPRELVGLARGRTHTWQYSNTNFVLLGLVVEAATGRKLADVLREAVFRPLNLHATTLPGPGERRPDASFGWAAGAIESTPREVARFLGALLRDAFIDTTELRRTVEVDSVEFDRYGLGIAEMSSILRLADSTCGPAWGHLGFGLEVTAAALAAPDGSRCLVVCTRGALDETGWQTLAEGAWALLCRALPAT